jgi:hypothetical protein
MLLLLLLLLLLMLLLLHLHLLMLLLLHLANSIWHGQLLRGTWGALHLRRISIRLRQGLLARGKVLRGHSGHARTLLGHHGVKAARRARTHGATHWRWAPHGRRPSRRTRMHGLSGHHVGRHPGGRGAGVGRHLAHHGRLIGRLAPGRTRRPHRVAHLRGGGGGGGGSRAAGACRAGGGTCGSTCNGHAVKYTGLTLTKDREKESATQRNRETCEL